MPMDENGQDPYVSGSVLVADPRKAVTGALEGFLSEANCMVEVLHDLDRAVERASEHRLVILGASDVSHEAIASRLKAEVSAELPVLLLYDPGTDGAADRCMAAGADSYLLGPLKKDTVVATARDLLRIGDLLQQIRNLEERLDSELARRKAGEEGAPAAEAPAAEGPAGKKDPNPVYDFEFFKRLLLMEVKRSRRYAYPISLALVALDDFQVLSRDWSVTDRSRAVGATLATVTRVVRDIDLPVLYAEDRILVFMPHTARDGALIVGGRLREAIRGASLDLESGERARLTASVGISAFEGRGKVSFASLIKDATLALREAQSAGGDSVEAAAPVARDRVVIG
ncbi:MAG: diguanylate cyclase [Deltaproteobacteria bacterium]|nr:diguanylate cyclase [Deltaproteobacteria bacterium]